MGTMQRQNFTQAYGVYADRMVEPVGPHINSYMTHQEALHHQTGGQLEFTDCQNPDATDGYVVGPNEKVPGYAPEYVKQQPHRELTDSECARYGLPKGTILMATKQEESRGEVPLIAEPPEILDPAQQIKEWFQKSGAKPWDGKAQATFASTGAPVPDQFMVPGYNPAQMAQQMQFNANAYGMGTMSPMPGSAIAMAPSHIGSAPVVQMPGSADIGSPLAPGQA